MSLFHAVAFVDHHSAQVLQFDDERVAERKVQEHLHLTRQHARGMRAQFEFFGKVCDALDGIEQVLVVGGGAANLAVFRSYVEAQRPLTAQRITAFNVVERPTAGGELVSMARRYFVEHDRLAAVPA